MLTGSILGILRSLVGIVDVLGSTVTVLVVFHRALIVLNSLGCIGIGLLQIRNALTQRTQRIVRTLQRALHLRAILNVTGLGDSRVGGIDGITGIGHCIDSLLIPGNGSNLIFLKVTDVLNVVHAGCAGRLNHGSRAQNRHDSDTDGIDNLSSLIYLAHITVPPPASLSFQYRQTDIAARPC